MYIIFDFLFSKGVNNVFNMRTEYYHDVIKLEIKNLILRSNCSQSDM